MLMASQTTPSSQVVPVNKQTLLTKSLHARASTGQCSQQTQSLGVATLSQQQVCLYNQEELTKQTFEVSYDIFIIKFYYLKN